MKLFIFVIMSLFVYVNANAQTWQPSSGRTQIPIWPHGKMPDAIPVTKPEEMKMSHNLIARKPWTWIENVARSIDILKK